MSFVHLHTHSEYSLLDGLGKVKKLAARARELEMPALALTDHGAMFGAIEFYQACKAEGLKPIIGIEAYLAPRGMADRDPQKDRRAYHLLLLAQNEAGYRNLLQIATASQLQGFYYYPRIDRDFLAAHAEGLICTTGCLNSEVPRAIVEGGEAEARRRLDWYYDVFGPQNFFFELQDHDIAELRQMNSALLALGSRYQARYVATNDVHYVRQEDHTLQDVLLCIQTGALVSDRSRLRMSDASYYLRSPQEMRQLLGHVPGAVENTLAIAERCEVDLGFKGYHLPNFEVPPGFTAETYLRHLCLDGLRRRYGSRADVPGLGERLDYELTIIHQMGFDTYFLIVWDLCRFAASRSIWYNARGSAAGSIVAYCLEITLVEPIEHDLIFERFLNPSRISMPDIDLDFQDDRRHEVLEYTAHKYGSDKVAQIITFGTLGARAAIRDVGRVLNVDLNHKVDPVAKTIPYIPGKPIRIEEALEQVPEFRARYEGDEEIRHMVDIAKNLEGVARNAGTHAAGVVITDKPIIDYIPLHRPTKGGGEDSPVNAVTQFEMEILDGLGLLKVDFLGLRTLTVMAHACEFIKRRHGVEYSLNNIPTTDPATYDLLGRGEVAGVFQVEGSGMRRFLMDMKPTRLAHIIAMVALYRPGPIDFIPTYIRRMHGEEPVEYRHPRLEPILSETYGIAVYQEQIMRAVMNLAGYSAAEADSFRKVVAKKKGDEMVAQRLKFVGGAVQNGIPEEVAEQIFADWETFARYGFNKSHAADYAVICVQTAFLKAHYPVEYMTALLTAEKGDTDKVAMYVADARRKGIEVLPPDVNYGGLDFTIDDRPGGSAIRFGLGAVKNVGEVPVAEIMRARAENGPFQTLDDFCRRVDLRLVGKRALECLVKVGALDSLAGRAELIAGLDGIFAASTSAHRAREAGQLDLFGGLEGANAVTTVDVPRHAPAISLKQMRSWEKELIGVYVSDHPLMARLDELQQLITHFSGELTEELNGRTATVAGQVARLRPHTSAKSGRPMGFLTLEDLQGSIEVVVFPRTWTDSGSWLEVDQIVVVTGRVDAKGRNIKILANSISREAWLTRPADRPSQPAGEPPAAASPTPPNRQTDGTREPPMPATGPADEEDPFAGEPWDPIEEAAGGQEDRSASAPAGAAGGGGNGGATFPQATMDGARPAPGPADGDFEPRRPTGSGGMGARPVVESTPFGASASDLPWRLRNGSSRSGEESARPPDGEPKRIVVTLHPTGDEETDRRRLQRLYDAFVSHPGHDRFTFVVFEPDGRRFELDFVNDTTRYCDDLKTQLFKFVTPDVIEVRALA